MKNKLQIIMTLLVLLTSMCFQSTAFSQDNEVTISANTIGDWNVRCEQVKSGAKSCVMMQQSFAKSSGQRIVQSNIAKVQGGSFMSILVPLGIYLPAGVVFTFDDEKSSKLELNFCNQEGCFVNQKVGPNLLEQLNNSKSAKITIEVNKSQAVDVPFSLNGFKEAYQAL